MLCLPAGSAGSSRSADGEKEGYTNLRDPAAFDTSAEALIEEAYSRHDAVTEFLPAGRGSNTTEAA